MRLFSGWLLRAGDRELEVLRLRTAGSNSDRGGLRPQLLMPGGDVVGASVEAWVRELRVRAGGRDDGVREDGDVGAHPRVNVALDVEDVLRLVEHRGCLLERPRHPLVE